MDGGAGGTDGGLLGDLLQFVVEGGTKGGELEPAGEGAAIDGGGFGRFVDALAGGGGMGTKTVLWR